MTEQIPPIDTEMVFGYIRQARAMKETIETGVPNFYHRFSILVFWLAIEMNEDGGVGEELKPDELAKFTEALQASIYTIHMLKKTTEVVNDNKPN